MKRKRRHDGCRHSALALGSHQHVKSVMHSRSQVLVRSLYRAGITELEHAPATSPVVSCELGVFDRLYVFRPSADVRAGARWVVRTRDLRCERARAARRKRFKMTRPPKTPRGLLRRGQDHRSLYHARGVSERSCIMREG